MRLHLRARACRICPTPPSLLSLALSLSLSLRLPLQLSLTQHPRTHNPQTECYKCIWKVVDAIHACSELDITFPIDDIEALKEMELEFAKQHEVTA